MSTIMASTAAVPDLGQLYHQYSVQLLAAAAERLAGTSPSPADDADDLAQDVWAWATHMPTVPSWTTLLEILDWLCAERTEAPLQEEPAGLLMTSVASTAAIPETAAIPATLEDQYESRVLSLVVHDLAMIAPAAGETTVMKLVADVWRQAEEHLAKAGRTGWAHISWFVQNAIATRAAGLQMAGC
ncbi:hypothetical protein ACFVVA_40155 [Kitasatospora sp. NPDC058048]|uniref:hypothetical protein n=1 Tax=Kitasatospora sp. NPDC058048 TaxID=3346313 RepID=UPI0036DFA1A6